MRDVSIRAFLAAHPAGSVAVDAAGDLWCVIDGVLHWAPVSDVERDLSDAWTPWTVFHDRVSGGSLRILPGVRYVEAPNAV